ncbi:hypothetical protein ACGE32_34345, partial [Klebsiella pneumoniae]
LHGPHVFNFTDVYGALDSARGARQVDTVDSLSAQIAAWLTDEVTRQRAIDAGRQVVEQLGGALERTLAALEPYLMQLRIERGVQRA